MLENFVPQPFPLECSPDGTTGARVVGWKVDQLHRVMPVISPGLAVAAEMTAGLQFRPADTRPGVAPRPSRIAAPVAAPRREPPA
jgi:hypothetical protein